MLELEIRGFRSPKFKTYTVSFKSITSSARMAFINAWKKSHLGRELTWPLAIVCLFASVSSNPWEKISVIAANYSNSWAVPVLA